MLDNTSEKSGQADLVEKLKQYVSAILHRPMQLAQWKGSSGLPTYLTHRYHLLAGSIADQPCLFAFDQEAAAATPADIAKHLARIGSGFDGNVIYVARRLSADRRARLIGHGAPFVIPGNQLYIPQLAIDLRERFRVRPQRNAEQLSPVAQAILFHYLLRLDERQNTPSRLAKALYYSAMSVGRGFEELLMHKLATVAQQGRTKKIQFLFERPALLEAARPLLRKPARSEIFIQSDTMMPSTKRAGESALAALTDLSPPQQPVEAIHINEWRVLGKVLDIAMVKHKDEASSVLELWHYDPKILSADPIVDPLSLYAQFWDHPDERVAGAAESLLERLEW